MRNRGIAATKWLDRVRLRKEDFKLKMPFNLQQSAVGPGATRGLSMDQAITEEAGPKVKTGKLEYHG